MIYGGVDSQAAKKILNKIMYFGRPDYNLPFLWALAHDFRMAAQVVLSSDEFAYLRDMFNDRRNPQATRLFYAISKYERTHVDRMSRAVEETRLVVAQAVRVGGVRPLGGKAAIYHPDAGRPPQVVRRHGSQRGHGGC